MITKYFKKYKFQLQEPKVTIIAGNNGSGKSTLLKILHGLIKTPNNVKINGEIILFLKSRKSSLWYFKHQFSLIEQFMKIYIM
jgi:ABC-type transport system involved in cytochrome c biogenesis ATPase subunit